MANYFDNKLLHPNKNGNELERRYAKELDEIDKLFKEKNGEISIVRKVERQWDHDHTSFRPIVPFALPTEIPLYLDELGAVSVRYSELPPQKQGENKIIWPTTRLFMQERMVLTPKDKDKAWYLLKATRFIKGEDNDKAFMWVDDPNHELEVQASEIERTLQVDNYLINKQSPLMNSTSIKLIADKFGIEIDESNIKAAAFSIRKEILSGEKSNNPDINIDKFISFAEKLEQKSGKAKTNELTSNPKGDEAYTEEFLMNLNQEDLNGVSAKFETKKVPQVKKVEQIALILEKQAELIEQ